MKASGRRRAGDGTQMTEDRRQKTEEIMREPILSFRDLHVYQVAFDLQQRVFKATKRFPKEETYSLTDQFRRASRSIGANTWPVK
jgi:hypothetical protein